MKVLGPQLYDKLVPSTISVQCISKISPPFNSHVWQPTASEYAHNAAFNLTDMKRWHYHCIQRNIARSGCWNCTCMWVCTGVNEWTQNYCQSCVTVGITRISRVRVFHKPHATLRHRWPAHRCADAINAGATSCVAVGYSTHLIVPVVAKLVYGLHVGVVVVCIVAHL